MYEKIKKKTELAYIYIYMWIRITGKSRATN